MLEPIFATIEGPEFAATVNMACGYKAFLRTLVSAPAFQELLSGTSSPEDLWAVLERVLEISRREVDPAYENPWDSALAAYLVALIAAGETGLSEIAAAIVLACDDCWWSRQIAEGLREGLAKRAGVRSSATLTSGTARVPRNHAGTSFQTVLGRLDLGPQKRQPFPIGLIEPPGDSFLSFGRRDLFRNVQSGNSHRQSLCIAEELA